VSSARVGIRKPNPRIFNLALEALGIPPEKAAMVGDTLGADILGARNAGLMGIWITRRADSAANRAHAETIRPDAIIATLQELPGLLDNIAATS
jgi:FMN phosphatase YigB (HAD superfamily)